MQVGLGVRGLPVNRESGLEDREWEAQRPAWNGHQDPSVLKRAVLT